MGMKMGFFANFVSLREEIRFEPHKAHKAHKVTHKNGDENGILCEIFVFARDLKYI
jgi:hypothetical protein